MPLELPGPFIPHLLGGDKKASQSRMAQAISEFIVNPGHRSCPQHKLREWKFFHSGSQGVESEKNITIKKRKKKKGKMDCHSLNKTRERGVRKMEKGREYERGIATGTWNSAERFS